ncbi:MAG TPA: ABC transporter permease [Pyrinomonadaceae bacterium]|nr:ABC transporter permease [Pyrinomonadaceae bacterium]
METLLMSLYDLFSLASRNLREARLRAALTTLGVTIGVTVVVTMVSLGLGLQRNTVEQFQDLDSFSEIHVFGRSLFNMAATEKSKSSSGANQSPESSIGGIPVSRIPERSLNDTTLGEIEKIPGVVFVKPNIIFQAYVRANERTVMKTVGGAAASEPSARFREFAAGRMIGSPDADEVVVDAGFLRDFGYTRASDAVGQTLALLDPPDVENEAAPPAAGALRIARTYRIVGVLKDEPDGNRLRGLLPSSSIYLPLPAARSWKDEHLDALGKIALHLAQQRGSVERDEKVSYTTAVIRVTDPSVIPDVRTRLTKLGLGSFSFVDEFKQVQTFFLIVNVLLGLIGGVSLLIASLGIANTMLMSILERTREIGIMKAIGAEEWEIKLIFVTEAAMIGLTGGIIGTLAAWGIDELANRLVFSFILQPQGSRYVEFFLLPLSLWLGIIAVAVLVSVSAALYPAARAARVEPVAALRHV